MTELSVISALVFAAVLGGVEAIYWLFFRSRHINKSINRRLELSKTLADPGQVSPALRDQHRIFNHKNPFLQNFNDFMAQCGLQLNRDAILVAMVALVAIMYFGSVFFVGHGITALTLAIFSALFLAFLFFRIKRQKRIARFAELLPDSIDVIVRAVRVGYPLPMAFQLVSREMPDPVGTEFATISDEISFGQDIRTATENLYRRVGEDDLLFLVVAINVQIQTGGNLAEILSRLSRLIRQRSRLRLKVQALSAEGRVSAVVLSLMPFILFGGISLISPGYFGEIRGHPLIEPALVYSAISLVIGNIVMYRMVNFKI